MPGRSKNRDSKKDGGQSADGIWDECLPVSREEWDFDPVPESEIIACCLWEFARESKTIHMVADLHWVHARAIWYREDYAMNPALKSEHDKEAKIIEKHAALEGFDYDGFMERFWETDYPLLEIYDSITSHARGGARPWQCLPELCRAELSKQVTRSDVLKPLADATVGELETLWNRNSSHLLEVRARPRAKDDDNELCALYNPTDPVAVPEEKPEEAKARITAAFTVDFSRFTDGEIIEEFVGWLARNRPVEWKKPRRVLPDARQKGRKQIEYRVALERLGLMRLLHWFGPAQLQAESPDAWRKIRGKEQSFRREIREAAKFFRKLFPFLPAEERPSHEQRFGTWMPTALRMADEVWRELYPEGDRKSGGI